MSTKTFKKQDIEAAVNKNTDDSSLLVLEEAGQWLDKGKFQYQENILEDTSTGQYYSFTSTRFGSHFTDYTYSFKWARDEIILVEVESIIIETEIWAAVRNKEIK